MKTTLGVPTLMLLGCTACSTGPYFTSGPQAAPSSAPVALTASASVTLTSEQILAVRAHYSTTSRSNGRGRNGGLPPGIARNLERGKPLPPGIARQYLPQNLVTVLPDPGRGLDYIVAAGKLLLVEAATQVVRDVLIDAIYS
jgi:hypothetical protein